MLLSFSSPCTQLSDLTDSLHHMLKTYAERNSQPCQAEQRRMLPFCELHSLDALGTLPQDSHPLRIIANLWGTHVNTSRIPQFISRLAPGSCLYASLPSPLNGYALDKAAAELNLPLCAIQRYSLEAVPEPYHTLTLNYSIEATTLLTAHEFQSYWLASDSCHTPHVLKHLCEWLQQRHEPVILSGTLVTWCV